jgi:hypothetical protein
LRITLRRTRLQDGDNAASGCKWIVDAIKRQRLIIDDSPKYIRLEVLQEQVATEAEIGTLVEIFDLEEL